MLKLLNNFIKTRLTVKLKDCNTLLGKAHTSVMVRAIFVLLDMKISYNLTTNWSDCKAV